MMENLGKVPSEHCQTAKIKPSMAAEGMHFPCRSNGGIISANLEVIREMSFKCVEARTRATC